MSTCPVLSPRSLEALPVAVPAVLWPPKGCHHPAPTLVPSAPVGHGEWPRGGWGLLPPPQGNSSYPRLCMAAGPAVPAVPG